MRWVDLLPPQLTDDNNDFKDNNDVLTNLNFPSNLSSLRVKVYRVEVLDPCFRVKFLFSTVSISKKKMYFFKEKKKKQYDLSLP